MSIHYIKMLLLTHIIYFSFILKVSHLPSLPPPAPQHKWCAFGWVDKKSSTRNLSNNSHENDLQGIYCDAIKIQNRNSNDCVTRRPACTLLFPHATRSESTRCSGECVLHVTTCKIIYTKRTIGHFIQCTWSTLCIV